MIRITRHREFSAAGKRALAHPHDAERFGSIQALRRRTPQTVRTTEDWVREFTEGWRDPRGADRFIAHFRELLDERVRLIQPQLATVVGRDAFAERFVRPLFALIPDLRADVDRWAVNGEEAIKHLAGVKGRSFCIGLHLGLLNGFNRNIIVSHFQRGLDHRKNITLDTVTVKRQIFYLNFQTSEV